MTQDYTAETLEMLKRQEEELVFERFTSKDALKLGSILVKLSEQYDREVSIRITRESDELVIFQYAGDTKTEANIVYMEGKRKASLESGHCSAYVYVANRLNHEFAYMFEKMPEYCPGAGAFPIMVNGIRTATVSVSGLHDGKDHELIIRGLEEMLQRKTEEFPWILV